MLDLIYPKKEDILSKIPSGRNYPTKELIVTAQTIYLVGTT